MRARGWVVSIYEAKATYDPRRGTYRQQAMKAGNADCMGVMPGGIGVAIEFKAPGKLSTFCRRGNEAQVDFIRERIQMGSFACVVDSASLLAEYVERWLELLKVSTYEAQNYLFSALPKRATSSNDVDDDDLGFLK